MNTDTLSNSIDPTEVTKLLAQAHEALSQLPPDITELGEIFTAAGQQIALVGGPVRDAMLGVSPHDFDLTTDAPPERTEELLRNWGAKTWDIGREYGTIGGNRAGLTVEITTYRTDSYQIGSRKPEVVYGSTLEGDLTRRDFTVNAMALRLPELALVDPHHGLEDLAAGILRTPVTAEQSFDDDPLRILRAIRFSAQLGFDVNEEVMFAMSAMASRLEIVSAERIRGELEKLMISRYPRRGIELMTHTGVSEVVLPELAQLQETVDEHNRHKDVYEHSLIVLEQAIDQETDAAGAVPRPDAILRWAALLHDIGKPATRRFEPGGAVSFHHHEIVGAKLARKRMRALRFDNQTIKAVTRLIELHLRFHGYGEQSWSDSAVRRYVTDAGDQLERLHRLTRADCTTRNQRKARYLSAAYDDLEERIAVLQEKEELAAIRPDLDGAAIMQILDLKPGPEVGAAYRFLLELRLEEGPLAPEEAETALRKWWQQKNAGSQED